MNEKKDLKNLKIRNYDVIMQEVEDSQSSKKYTVIIENKKAEKSIDKFLSDRVYTNFMRATDKYNEILDGRIFSFLINAESIEAAEKIVEEMIEVYDNRDRKEELKNNMDELLEGFDDVLEDSYNNFYIDLSDEQKAELYALIVTTITYYVEKL